MDGDIDCNVRAVFTVKSNEFLENKHMAKKLLRKENGNSEASRTRNVYVPESFKNKWNSFLEKFGRKGQNERDSINSYYRDSIELIKRGTIGRSGAVEVKYLEYVPSKGTGRFFECKQKKIPGTNFCPRILFVNVRGTSNSILLDVIDKDDDRIGSSVLGSLSSKYKMALQNDYASVYSKN